MVASGHCFSAPLAFWALKWAGSMRSSGGAVDNPRIYARRGGATTSPNVRILFSSSSLYIVLGTMCVFVLRRLFRNKPAEAELDEIVKEKRSTGKGEPV